MKKILITGADGMLGMDLAPILSTNGYQIIQTDINSMDITNSNEINEIFSRELPDYVIHCAAYTNVDKAEENFEIAEEINVSGTKNIAQACEQFGTIPIYISTDYVFDGKKNSYYTPNDKPNPLNNYGKTKLAGEQAIQSICSKYYIVRTSWLYVNYGKNFIETMLSLTTKAEIKVVNDQIGCPTWTIELSEGILKILKEQKPFGIYHICGKEAVSWYEFAKKIFKASNSTVNLLACTSEEFKTKALRPSYSVLTNDLAVDALEENIKKYLNLRERMIKQ